MTPEMAQLILQFMQRVELKGAEVPAFNQAVAALADEAKPPEEVSDEKTTASTDESTGPKSDTERDQAEPE